MAEPTSILKFEDLITRVAREAGIAYHGTAGDTKAMPPIDIHDLELCKEIVNDAIRMFIADAPRTGWRWRRRIMRVSVDNTRATGTVDSIPVANQLTDATLETTYDTNDDLNDYWCYILTGTGAGSYAQITDYVASGGTITVADWLKANGAAGGTDPAATDTYAITKYETVAGDIARYPLAENFGGEVTGEIHYEKNSTHSALIDWVHESFIRRRKAQIVITGYPHYAAIRPLEPTSNALYPTRRYELVLDPDPNSTQVLEFPYVLTFDELDMECGVGDSGNNTTIVDATRTEGDEYFVGWKITIISGTGKGSYAIVVTPYTGSSGTFTVDDWLKADGTAGGTNPGANSIYSVEPQNNLHPAGARYDQAILSASLAQAEIMIEDIVSGFMNKYIQKDLMTAHQANARSAPRTLGTMNMSRRHHRYRRWDDITTENDV